MSSVVRRLATSALSFALTAGAALACASPAAAEDVTVYEGQYGSTWYTYTARCSGLTCQLSTENPPAILAEFMEAPLTVSGGSAREQRPNTCGTSDDGFRPPRSMALTLTESDLTATVVWEAGDWRINGSICSSTGSTDVIRAKVYPQADGTADSTAADPDGVTSAGQDTGRSDSSGPSTSRLASGEPNAPSVLSALRTSGDIEARSVVLSALLTIVLVLLIAFPTTLLNSAAEQGSDRFSAWWRRRRHRGEPPDPTSSSGAPWWWAAGGVLGAGVISSFVDPQFGLNAGSVRTVFSIFVGFAVEVVLGWVVVVWLVRRTMPAATASFVFRPFSLGLVAAAVAVTRVTGFEPGIIFGLVAGVGFASLAGHSAEAKAALAPLGYGAVVALFAWSAFHLVDQATSTTGVFMAEALSAMAVAGLAALPIALFPVPGMPGAVVFAWSRRAWLAFYAFGLFAFFVVLLPTPYAWDEVGWTLKAWVIGYLVYLAFAVAAWAVLNRNSTDQDLDDPPPSSSVPSPAHLSRGSS